jgi:uncharacterized oligopeptide transporter (OPT) family protein
MMIQSKNIFIKVTTFQIQKSLNIKSKIAMMNNLTKARSLLKKTNGPRYNSASQMRTETYMSLDYQMMSILKE